MDAAEYPRSLANLRYLLVQPLGEGGMAAVFRGYDQRLKAWRAVKIMAPQLSKKVKLRQRFEGEAQTMALLEHRNIVRVYDVGEDGDAAYIVMEILEGGCLVDWLEEHGPMPPRMAVECVIEIAAGLSAAHAKGVIHRDIKPHNVLISNEGECRITDFGIARINDGDISMTKTGAVMGTWGYMAPEQRVDAKHVDGRADEYALGATLYSLLTNKTPMDLFAADRDSAMMEGLPLELVDVMLKATEYKREARYEDVAAFAAALKAVLPSLPEVPADTPPLARPVKPPPPTPDPADYTPKLTSATTPANSTMGWAGNEDEAFQMALGAGGGAQQVVEVAQAATQIRPPESLAGLNSNPTLADAQNGPHLGGPTLSGAGGLPSHSVPDVVVPPPRRSASGLAVLGLTGGLFFVGFTLLVAAGAAVFVFRGDTPVVAADAGTDVGTQAVADADPATQGAADTDAPKEAGTEAPAVADLGTEPAPVKPVVEPKPPVKPPAQVTTPPVKPVEAVVVTKPPEVVAVSAPKSDCLSAKPPGQAGPGAPFEARLCDDDRNALVVLHWRASGGEWQTSQMPYRLGAYRTKLPGDQVFSGGVEYWISAGDYTVGSVTSPKKLK